MCAFLMLSFLKICAIMWLHAFQIKMLRFVGIPQNEALRAQRYNMETIIREIAIAVMGSMFGALFVFFKSQGWQVTKLARAKRRELRHLEEQKWKTQEYGIRQGITNDYLFEILKYLLLGIICLAGATMLTLLDVTNGMNSIAYFIVYRIFMIVCIIIAFVCFYFGLGKAERYLRLRATDWDTNK